MPVAEQPINSQMLIVPMNKLKPGENHSRAYKPSDEAWKGIIAQLKPAIKAGTIEPVWVSAPNDKGIYTVLAGFQRYQAAKELAVDKLPIKLTNLEPDSVEAFDLNLIENLHREEPSFVEQAQAAKAYGVQHGIENWANDKKVARFFRMAPMTLQLAASLLEKCSDTVLRKLHDGELAIEGARVLAGLPQEAQDLLLKQAVIVKSEEDDEKATVKASKTSKTATGKKTRAAKKVSAKHISAAAEKVLEPTPEMEKVAKEVKTAIKADKEKRAAMEASKAAKNKGKGPSLDDLYTFFDDLANSDNAAVAAIGKLLVAAHEGKMALMAVKSQLEDNFS